MSSTNSLPPEQRNAEGVPIQYTLPGRIGNPDMKLFQEPRAHPKLVEVLSAFGLDGSQGDPFKGLSLEELSSSDMMAKSEAHMEKFFDTLPNDLPGDAHEPQILEETITFTSFDGTARNMYVFRPAEQSGPLPVVMYLHGGGMVILHTRSKVHDRWVKSLAVQGVVAISVDFRNAYSNGTHNPFPIGLNDCAAAVQYVSEHRAELNISKIVVQGESGGANLSLATALKANREGWVDAIAGVYAVVPSTSNGYNWSDARKLKELPSLYECDGYWLSAAVVAGTSKYYCGDATEDPVAWPHHASIEDCKGLPPHILTMDELDLLRDEGIAYYRKLLAAGVEAHAQVNLGLVHASALIFRKLLPEVHNKAIRDIASFAKSL